MFEYVQSAGGWIASWPWQVIWGEVKSSVFPLVAPTAAVYVAYKFGRIQADIGRRQAETAALAMNTARTKLRLDLFDKRLAVYEAAKKVIDVASAKGQLSTQDQAVYLKQIKDAPWLFGEDVNSYLTELSSLVRNLVEVMAQLAQETDETHRQKLVERKTDWFLAICGDYGPKLQTVMSPYLLFSNAKNM